MRTLTELEPGEFVTLVVDGETYEAARYMGREYNPDGTFSLHFIAWENGQGYDWYIRSDGSRFTYGGGLHTVTLDA